jgi:plastocyanin
MTKLVALTVLWFAIGGPPSRPHDILQREKSFSKTELTIQQSDSVFFHNNDSVVHNVFSTSPGNRFNLKPQKPGTTSVVVFTATGRVTVRCAFHPSMTLIVNVE